MKEKIKIGLALGSGAARGLAHIGIIEVLNEFNIDIDYVSGSSIGALIGSLHCIGMDFKYVKEIFKCLSPKSYIDITVPRMGLIRGERITEGIKLVTKGCEFKDLKIPLYVATTDLKNKEVKIINSGKVYEAVRASIAIPGIFTPYVIDDTILVDGGVLERVPAGILKQIGADYVIGVDVGFNMTSSNCRNIFDILYESYDLLQREYFAYKKQEADMFIRVDLNDFDPFRFDLIEECVAKGREAILKVIDKIQRDIEKIKCLA